MSVHQQSNLFAHYEHEMAFLFYLVPSLPIGGVSCAGVCIRAYVQMCMQIQKRKVTSEFHLIFFNLLRKVNTLVHLMFATCSFSTSISGNVSLPFYTTPLQNGWGRKIRFLNAIFTCQSIHFLITS